MSQLPVAADIPLSDKKLLKILEDPDFFSDIPVVPDNSDDDDSEEETEVIEYHDHESDSEQEIDEDHEYKLESNNKIVRAEEGEGARQIDAPKSFKKKDILEKAIDLYFSNGKSIKKGPLADYDVDLLDFAANIFDDNLTVEQIFAMTGFTRLNFYMYTTLKPELAEKRKKQKVQKGKKKIQISSSSEDEPSNNHTPQTRHQRKRKQNSEYSLSTSLSTEFGENEDVKDVSNSETTNCLTNEIFLFRGIS
ncbi:hypothetical protein FQR65_LT14980 [Abscondita terminalis]|nr:hypothetical protein FQR65_LT14980 [Abscondita terminalis]